MTCLEPEGFFYRPTVLYLSIGRTIDTKTEVFGVRVFKLLDLLVFRV